MYDPKVHNIKRFKDFRKRLRKRSTDAEDLLWKFLRGRSLGVRFRRQFGIKNFIVDFCCWKKKVVVEVDGGIHNKPEVVEYDKVRTEILEGLDFKVLRFTNKEVLDNPYLIVEKIKKFL